MRKIIAHTFISLDGVLQAPGGPEEDPTGAFKHGGWSAGYWDQAMADVMAEFLGKPFDLLLGRRTYEIFAAHWPFVKTDADEFDKAAADALNNARKYVVSKTLKTVDWQNAVLIKGDAVDGVGALKSQAGPEIQVHGSGGLLQTLLAHDLVDELCVWTFPLTLGNGKRLFGDGARPRGLKLIAVKTSTTGVVIAHYGREGEIKAGSFAHETPTQAELERRKRWKAEEKGGARIPLTVR